MYCHVYLRNGIVYVPTMGEMGRGFYRGIEPVAVVPASNTKELHKVLLDAINRGNPRVSVLSRREHPAPVLLKFAGVKTLQAFEDGSALWSVGVKNGIYEINAYKKAARGSVRDPDQKISFQPGTALDTVIERIVTILQDATRQ